ncbi:MAG: NUDIX hydrolase [Mycobacteriales bacterium]
MPPELLDRARLADEPDFVPAATRDAATVALLRDAPAGPEVYLLRRVRGMSFAGGMHVFPGGSVDPADADSDVDAASWAAAFGVPEPVARALVCAAVRETFEESGVLLAGTTADDLLADVSTDEWEAERVALEAREQSLSDLLARRGLVLRADLLRPLAHWITPDVEPKRFDTRFFVASLPAGQVCRDAGTEADTRVWIRPQDALDQGLQLMPPTVAVLQDLARFSSVAEALAVSRTIEPVQPKFRVAPDGGLLLLMPGDPAY